MSETLIPHVLQQNEAQLLATWLDSQNSAQGARPDLLDPAEQREQSSRLLKLLRRAIIEGDPSDLQGVDWSEVRDFLSEIARSRTLQGFSPTETALFPLSLKPVLFDELRRAHAGNGRHLFEDLGTVTSIIDQLALYTTEVYQRSREDIIGRQRSEMVEISSPVVLLWDGILGLPLIGTLDSRRTQVVMESLLTGLAQSAATVAIVDITGVPAVDTLTAQHLLKTVQATRLMGASCIISGIRPQIAQAMVQLGVDLGNVPTRSTLASALALAFKLRGLRVQTEQASS